MAENKTQRIEPVKPEHKKAAVEELAKLAKKQKLDSYADVATLVSQQSKLHSKAKVQGDVEHAIAVYGQSAVRTLHDFIKAVMAEAGIVAKPAAGKGAAKGASKSASKSAAKGGAKKGGAKKGGAKKAATKSPSKAAAVKKPSGELTVEPVAED